MPWCSLTHENCVAQELEKIHDLRAADNSFNDSCARGLAALLVACRQALSGPEHRVAPFDWTPDVKLEPFGSTEQGTALRSSDLDVRLSFEQFAVKDPERMQHYLDAIAEAIRKLPTNSCLASRGDLEVVRVVRGNRLPVLRLKYEGSLDVDLTMGEDFAGGADLDRLVDEVLSAAVDDGARHFVRLVKAFSKAQGLVDAYSGYMNSLSWVLLAIGFLQREACLPSCRHVRKGRVTSGKRKIHLWPARISAGFFVRFFAFISSLGHVPWKISIWNGDVYRAHPFSLGGNPAHPLYIENPLRRDFNVALCLRDSCWRVILERCSRAREELQDAAPCCLQTSVLTQMFVGETNACEEADLPAAKRAKS